MAIRYNVWVPRYGMRGTGCKIQVQDAGFGFLAEEPPREQQVFTMDTTVVLSGLSMEYARVVLQNKTSHNHTSIQM